MAENQNAYRLLSEGVVIVCSILLAFIIQAWWDETRDREDATRLLASIQAENRQNMNPHICFVGRPRSWLEGGAV